MLNFKGRFCLFIIEVAQRPAQYLRRIRGGDILTFFPKISRIHAGKLLGFPDDRTEIFTTEKIIDYAVPLGFITSRNGVIFPSLQRSNIVTRSNVSNRQFSAGQKLIEKPDPSRILSGWFGFDVVSKLHLGNMFKYLL